MNIFVCILHVWVACYTAHGKARGQLAGVDAPPTMEVPRVELVASHVPLSAEPS